MVQGREAMAVASGRGGSAGRGDLQAVTSASLSLRISSTSGSPSNVRRYDRRDEDLSRPSTRTTLSGRRGVRDAGQHFDSRELHEKLLLLQQQGRRPHTATDFASTAATGDAEQARGREASFAKRAARGCKDPALRLRCRTAAAHEPHLSAATIFTADGEHKYERLKERVIKAVKSTVPPEQKGNPAVAAESRKQSDEALDIKRAAKSMTEARGKTRGLLKDTPPQKRLLGTPARAKQRRAGERQWGDKSVATAADSVAARRAALRSVASDRIGPSPRTVPVLDTSQLFKPGLAVDGDAAKKAKGPKGPRRVSTCSLSARAEDRSEAKGHRPPPAPAMAAAAPRKGNAPSRPATVGSARGPFSPVEKGTEGKTKAGAVGTRQKRE